MRIKCSTGRTFFSKRRQRFDSDRTPRSLTFSCYQRFRFLSKDRTGEWFVRALLDGKKKYAIDLWAWVIMPEHVHLLVCPQENGKDVSQFLGYVKEKVAREAVQWMSENAPEWLPKITVAEGQRTRHRFWQSGDGYDRNLDNDRAILSTIDYQHENPVRCGLVERQTDWEWSSARWYAGESAVHLEMDRTLPVFKE